MAFLCHTVQAGGIRDHTRSVHSKDAQTDTQVSESQAQILSLTLADVTTHQIQVWVRTAGRIDDSGRTLVATSCVDTAAFIQVGQRVIAFQADTKSSISQARISSVNSMNSCTRIEAELATSHHESDDFYVMEIIVPRGRFLAIAKEAIIEEEGRSWTYVQSHEGHYQPRTIDTGIKGERYTQVLSGLKSGEQIVTLGSFFIHAQHQLNKTSGSESSHAHHAH